MNVEYDPLFVPLRRPWAWRRIGSVAGRLALLLGTLAGAVAMWLVVIEFAFWVWGLG